SRDNRMSADPLVTDMVELAETNAVATIELLAKKGRASYLGERSIGHRDPGATSSLLMIKALQQAIVGN
ncbi:DAK2 domain-containing protein, partial [Vibrio parahaemolyticus]|uniref:DAK2 domain-containing protein n=1 Tax=Vibrio parahaemolyticus TaxID=670 RepID=UPI00211112A7